MTKGLTIRIPDEWYDYIEQQVLKNESRSMNEYINKAIESFIQPKNDPVVIYRESETDTKIEELKNELHFYKDQLIQKDKLLDSLNLQLHVKDKQIFSILELNKEDKEQVKLLTNKISSKKWYYFWK